VKDNAMPIGGLGMLVLPALDRWTFTSERGP